MRDHEEAFSPTVPDDEDGSVPAPGAPSQERPEYEGEPSFRGANDVEPRPGSIEADEDGEYVSHEPVDPAVDDDGTLQENPSNVVDPDDPSSTSAGEDAAGTAETVTKSRSSKSGRPSSQT